MSGPLELLISALLLIGNAFFVGAEFAIITARRDRLRTLTDAGNRAARVTLRAGEHLLLLITGAQLGVTLCSLGLGRLGEPAASALLEWPFDLLGMPPSLRHPIAFVLALGIVVILHTVIGEIDRKSVV